MPTNDLTRHPLESDDPHHFTNLVTPKLRECLFKIPHDLLGATEGQITYRVYGTKPGETDQMLRISFWNEYNNAVASKSRMKMESIFRGICSQQTFYNIVSDHGRLAFIITEPASAKKEASFILSLSWKRMKEIMETRASVNERTGMLDSKLMELQLKLFQYLDQREHGSIVQRAENLNVNVEAKELPQFKSMEQIDKEIAELEKRVNLPLEMREAKEVLAIEATCDVPSIESVRIKEGN